MAKEVKDAVLQSRVTTPYKERVNEYIANSDDLTEGELVRRGVDEYMANHPIKKEASQVPEHLRIKPGA